MQPTPNKVGQSDPFKMVWGLLAVIPLLFLGTATGCSTREQKPEVSSEKPIMTWLDGLGQGDLEVIQAGLSRSTKENWDRESLREAIALRRQLMGGVAEKYRIQSLTEKDQESRVHLIWTRKGLGHGTRFKESYVFRRENGEWRVVLGSNWYHQ